MKRKIVKQFCQSIFAGLLFVGAFQPVSATEPADSGLTEIDESTDTANDIPQNTEEVFDVPVSSSEPVTSSEPVVSEEPLPSESPLPSETPVVTETPVPSTEPVTEDTAGVVVNTWQIDSEVLVFENDQYTLTLSASPESPVTRDVVSGQLPSHVLVNTGEAVEVTWDLSVIPEGGITEDGTYVVSGTLAEGYALAEGVKAVEVQVITTGTEVYANGEEYEEYFVQDTVSPGGTVINLFDYWVDPNDRWADDTGINAKGSNTGINQDRKLKFFGSADDGDYINSFTNGGIKQNIVQNVLGADGYPILSTGESLNYLFNSSSDGKGQPGKAAYMDVKGLLQSGYQEDNEYNGYYFFDANKNFAVFNEEGNSFSLYNNWGVKQGGNLADSSNGQFFPFNSGSDVFDNSNGKLNQKDIHGNDSKLHHLFGISMTSRFIQQSGGKNNGTPVVYEFSGDDDVWIFIDDVLVGDLGGVHNHADISIDFSTGNIIVKEYPTGNTENGRIVENTTIFDKFQSAEKANTVTWNKNTFADNTYHTLSFFYLERGGGASNMKLKYNLVTVPESSIVKVDQTGDKIEGAEFDLKIRSKADPSLQETVASGTTNANGSFVFLDPESRLPIGLNDLKTKLDNFNNNHSVSDAEIILCETSIPPGYRGIQEIPLEFIRDPNVDQNVLIVNNYWTNGSYAMPQVTTTLQKMINFYDNDTKVCKGTINLSTEGNRYDRHLFAVVLKKKENEWRPISGTYEDGYTVAKNSSMESVIAAAKSDDNWFPFQLTNSTDYQVNITELPGDITKYFHFAGDKAEYAVGYYYTTASSKELIEPENTYPIYYPGLADSANNIAKREFSSRIYVPNIKNRIIVQKQDDQNKDYHVAGAKFNLYKVGLDGKEELYDSITTSESMKDSQGVDLIGANSFPSSDQKPLEYGTYYIQEAPLSEQREYTIVHKEGRDIIKEQVPADAYIVNPERIKVIVDETGIYAYAGNENENDGVSVQYGVGAIVRSMLRFAEVDDIDTTLHDITASLMRSNSKEDSDPVKLDYSKETDDVNINELDLAYNASSALYEYGPVDSNGVTAFTVNSGWAKVKIQQCDDPNHRVTGTDAHFEKLGETDLSNIFSRSVVVRVKNQSAGEFKLTNIVDAEGRLAAYENEVFQFNLQLYATDNLKLAFDAALPETISAKISGTDTTIQLTKNGNMYSTDSDKLISLANGQSIVFEQLPAGIKFAVSEVEDTSFITDVSSEIVSMVEEGQASTDGAIDDPPDNPDSGMMPRSGTIQRFNRTEVAYTNTPTEFVFYKVDSTGKPGEKGKPLFGAVFALYKLNDNLDIGYTNYSDTLLETDASGKLKNEQQSKDWTLIETKVISGSSIKYISTVTSNANGIVSFSGIPYDAKEFRLVELTAPPGYTVPTGQWRIIFDGNKSFKPIEDVSAVKNPPAIESINQKQDSKDPIKYQIRNYKPQDLPSSGNTGIGWFMKTGGALMISSALFIFFLVQRRKKHESKITSQE